MTGTTIELAEVNSQHQFFDLIGVTTDGELVVRYPQSFDNVNTSLNGYNEYLNWLLNTTFCTQYELSKPASYSNCGLDHPPIYPIQQHKPVKPNPGFCRGRKNL